LNNVTDGTFTFGSAAQPVKNVLAKCGKGDDSVSLGSNGNPNFALAGNLTLNFTTGNKTVGNVSVAGGTIAVGGNFAIASTVGATKTNLIHDMTVGRSMTVNNGTGNTTTDFYTATGLINSFGGNVVVVNGAGFDQNLLFNANVTGSVQFKNGAGAANGAGT